MQKDNKPTFLFCQGDQRPVVGWESIRANHHQKPEYLIQAKARMEEAGRDWLAETDAWPPDYEVMRNKHIVYQQAEAAYRAAWQRWNEEKAAQLAALN